MMYHAQQNRPLSDNLMAVIDRLLDPTHGLVTSVHEDKPLRQAAGIRIVRTTVAPPAYFRGNAPSPVKTVEDGYGAAFDRETAYWAAIGESVERYSASIYWPDHFIVATARALGTRAVAMAPLIRVARPETCAFDPDSARAWMEGVDLATGEASLVPAMLCYLGYRSQYPGEVIAQSDSTGLACATSFDDGCKRGLCEVIERDAFAANWLLSRQPPVMTFTAADIAGFPAAVAAALTDNNLSIRLLHVAKSFGVHVVMAFVSDGVSLCSIGAAASPSLRRAVEKATAEVLQGWSAVNAFPVLTEPLTLEGLKTPFDQLRYYMHAERLHLLEAMCGGSEAAAFGDLCAGDQPDMTARDIARRLTADGFQAAAADLSTSDVSDLNFTVVRVVVPGLQPLVFGPASVQVPDERRLDQWRTMWGIAGSALNPHPHPFP